MAKLNVMKAIRENAGKIDIRYDLSAGQINDILENCRDKGDIIYNFFAIGYIQGKKAQQRAVHKYVKNNYDRIELTVKKGQKDIIKAHATARGESLNGFIGRAIAETIARDNTEART